MRGVLDLDREICLCVAVDIALDDLADRTPESVQLTGRAGERRVIADKVEGIVCARSIRRVGVD
jgi:DNA-binding IclR family transcriptional regulator